MFISRTPQIYEIAVELNIKTAPEKNNEKYYFRYNYWKLTHMANYKCVKKKISFYT